MQLLLCFVIILGAVVARRIIFFDKNVPIRLIDTSYGQGDLERIDYIEAVIHPRHLKDAGRINFSTTGDLNQYFLQAKADGDSRGHFIGSQFSGPATWYNLSPQNIRANHDQDYEALTTMWHWAECQAKNFLSQGGDRRVNWNVRTTYIKDSNRPHQYHVQVYFLENGVDNNNGIDILVNNPFAKDDGQLWNCKSCNDQCTHA